MTKASASKIEVYVPLEAAEEVKEALFTAGAGHIGAYGRCCWQTEGTGQFHPLAGSYPYLGRQGETETVKEVKIELICAADKLEAALAAMIEAHPYETPAFQAWPVQTGINSPT